MREHKCRYDKAANKHTWSTGTREQGSKGSSKQKDYGNNQKRNSEPYLMAFFILRVEDEHTVFFDKGVLQDVPFLRSHLSVVVGHPSLGFFHYRQMDTQSQL